MNTLLNLGFTHSTGTCSNLWRVTLRAFGTTLCIVLFVSVFENTGNADDLAAEKIKSWEFRRSDSTNANREPDGWRRRQDRQHASFIPIRTVPRIPAIAEHALRAQMHLTRIKHAFEVGYWDREYYPETIPKEISSLVEKVALNSCLEISMDGGAAELVSPPFPIDSRFSYSMRAEVSCEGLDGHEAWVELQLLDSQGSISASLATEKIDGTKRWRVYETDVASAVESQLALGRVHLKVKPKHATLISGIARFDSIEIYRLPRLQLQMDLDQHIARPGEQFDLRCIAMGIDKSQVNIQFEMYDWNNERVDSYRTQLEQLDHSAMFRFPNGPEFTSAYPANPAMTEAITGYHDEDVFDGEAVWPLSIDTPGLYRLRVKLSGAGIDDDSSKSLGDREILVGILPNLAPMNAGVFGWDVAGFDESITPGMLPSMVRKFGAGWVKYPVWFRSQDTEHADNLVALTEKLQAIGIECVGRLDGPPPEDRSLFGGNVDRVYSVTTFRDPAMWEPILEPVLTRMGLLLDWFQLGAHDDHSFMGTAEAISIIDDIRARMQSYSQELKLAIRWKWLDSEPEAKLPPWNAMHRTSEPILTSGELESYLDELGPDDGYKKNWISIDPLPSEQYELRDRVRDLVERMISTRKSNVQAAFLSDPFHDQSWLFDSEANVGEMLLPWAHMCKAVGSSSYIGKIDLPGESINHIFVGEKSRTGSMIIWNDADVTENLYLGEAVTAKDVWGAPIEVRRTKMDDGRLVHSFDVGSLPIIIDGIDIQVIQWRQEMAMKKESLPSEVGTSLKLPLSLKNTLPEDAVGKVILYGPTLLKGGRSEKTIRIGRGRRIEIGIPIVLRQDASAGKHELRFDFQVKAGRDYQFSVHREITLGVGDIEFLWETIRSDDDRIEIRIEVVNNTSRSVSFDCKFFPPGVPYQRFQVLDAARGRSQHTKTLTVKRVDGEAQAWIRCEQLGTGRILNYHVPLP